MRSGLIVCSENIYVAEHEHAGRTEPPLSLALFHSDSTLNDIIYVAFNARSLTLSVSTRHRWGEYATV